MYLPTSYGSLVAFFLLGAALIAVGVFLSSLTETQGFAAGMGIAAILINYFSVSLAEYVSATAFSTAVALFVLALAVAGVIWLLTRHEMLSYTVGLGLMAATTVTYLIDETRLEGLLPDLMSSLSLFSRLDTFVGGVFDVVCTSISLLALLQLGSVFQRQPNQSLCLIGHKQRDIQHIIV